MDVPRFDRVRYEGRRLLRPALDKPLGTMVGIASPVFSRRERKAKVGSYRTANQ